MAKQDPPRGLRADGKRLWVEITSKYVLRPDELHTLGDACRAVDRIATMRTELGKRDIVTSGSMGQEVVHPLVSEIRAHEAQVAGLLAKLKLPDAPAGAGASNQQRQAAQTRWAQAHGSGA